MKRKQFFSVAAIGVLSLLFVAGVAAAAVFSEDNTFTGVVNSFEKGIKIGKQGSGGVTFFNGTIVNSTTTNGVDNPVTFGDNLRIDGKIHRGETAGPAGAVVDTKPVQVNDDLEVYGQTTMKRKAKFEGGVEGLDFAAANHNHDDRYYTESETNNTFVSKSNPTWNEVTTYSMVGPSDFSPLDDTYQFWQVNNGEYLRATNAASRYWSASIHLPHGAVVTKVKMFYKDSSVVDATGKLMRLNLNNEVSEEMAALTTVGDSGALTSVEDSSINNSAIDNSNYQYHYSLDFNGVITIFLYNVVFEYKVSHF